MKNIFVLVLVFSQSSSAQVTPHRSWVTECNVFGRHSFIAITRFIENEQYVDFKLFEDKICRSHSLTVNYVGSFSTGQTFGEGVSIDAIPSVVLMTVHLKTVVDQFNDPKTVDGCGNKNWKIDYPQDVSGQYCRPFQMPTIGETLYDIVSSQKGEIRFGGIPLNWTLNDPGLRPLKLSNIVFSLQSERNAKNRRFNKLYFREIE